MTDCLNGGTLTAISNLVTAYPLHTHSLLWDVHADSPGPNAIEINQMTSNSYNWTGNLLQKILTLRKIVKQINPDLVHLHSSRAGLLGRLFSQGFQIAYSPHGFGFMRKDLPFIIRRGIYVIEKLLSFRTDWYVANWPLDTVQMQQLNKKVSVRFVPLIDTNFSNYRFNSLVGHHKRVIGIGRITAAKGIEEFTSLSSDPLIFKSSNVKFIWIGSFEETGFTEQSTSRVEFINWLPKESLNRLIQSSIVLIVSSKWESGPLTFYESLRQGVPSIVRNIEAFYWLDSNKFNSAKDASATLTLILSSESERRKMFQSQVKQVEKTFYDLMNRYPEYF